jgi:PAS domain S-box-containing protein
MTLAARLGLIMTACALAVTTVVVAIAWATQDTISAAIERDGAGLLRRESERYLAAQAASEAALLALRLDQIEAFARHLAGRERRPLSLLAIAAPTLVEVGVVDANGRMTGRRGAVPATAAAAFLAELPAHRDGDTGGWLEPGTDPLSAGREPALRLWIPADNGGGTILVLPLAQVLAQAEARQPVHSTWPVLFAADGRVAGAGDRGRAELGLATVPGRPWSGIPDIAGFLERIRRGDQGAQSLDLAGNRRLAAMAAVGAHPYRVVLVAPESVAIAGAAELGTSVQRAQDRGLVRLLSGALAVAAVMVAGTVVLAVALSRPVRALAESATAFGHGRYELRAPVRGGGEIATLALAFNRMADEIAARIRALSETTARLRLVMEGADVGIWDLDLASGRLVVNDRWAEMLGRRLIDLEPAGYATWTSLVHPDDLPRAEEALHRHLRGESSVYVMEIRMRHADGRWIWIETKGRVVARGPDGAAGRAAGTHLDIDARKAAEAVLRRSREELEDLVRLRTEELSAAHRELLRLAHQAGRAEVATGVLHNVGNALTGLVAGQDGLRRRAEDGAHRHLDVWVGLMERSGDPELWLAQDAKGRQTPLFLSRLAAGLTAERRADLAALGAMERATDHIRRILAIQQAQATGARLVETIDLGELLDHAVELRRSAIDGAGIQVVRTGGPLSWRGERHRILQILANLIANGTEAMRDGPGRTLTIGLDTGDGCAVITVADQGHGFTAAVAERLFTFGFTTRPGGHGIGLHACRLEAQGMGARLDGRSDGPGLGAIFTLRLPPAGGAGAAVERP